MTKKRAEKVLKTVGKILRACAILPLSFYLDLFTPSFDIYPKSCCCPTCLSLTHTCIHVRTQEIYTDKQIRQIVVVSVKLLLPTTFWRMKPCHGSGALSLARSLLFPKILSSVHPATNEQERRRKEQQFDDDDDQVGRRRGSSRKRFIAHLHQAIHHVRTYYVVPLLDTLVRVRSSARYLRINTYLVVRCCTYVTLLDLLF